MPTGAIRNGTQKRLRLSRNCRRSAPWGCLALFHEFLAIVRIRESTTTTRLAKAIEQVENLMESPSLQLLGELKGH